MDFLPYGEQTAGGAWTTHKLTGKERDAETQLDYFGARYYSNGLGRFITPDWAAKATAVPYANYGNPQSLNLYTYSKNNPTTFGDPDGHDPGDNIVRFLTALGYETLVTGFEIMHALSSGGGHMGALPPPRCVCPSPNQNNNEQNKNQQNNNSQSSNNQEQPRDAQGKFLPKKGGEAAPGAAAEKEGLDSIGADKNTNEILNGTKRDGTIRGTLQHAEIKSGESVNDTKQLQNMGQAAMDKTGQPLKVVTTNPNVKVSKPAQQNRNLQIEPMRKK
jgi:RHS repeat-associated protein